MELFIYGIVWDAHRDENNDPYHILYVIEILIPYIEYIPGIRHLICTLSYFVVVKCLSFLPTVYAPSHILYW